MSYLPTFGSGGLLLHCIRKKNIARLHKASKNVRSTENLSHVKEM